MNGVIRLVVHGVLAMMSAALADGVQAQSGRVLAGKLVLPTGQAVPGLMVSLAPTPWPDDILAPGTFARTDRYGRFRVELPVSLEPEIGLAATRRLWRVTVESNGWRMLEVTSLALGAIGDEFVVVRTAPMRGTLSDTDGLPLVGVSLRAVPIDNGDPESVLQAVTDMSGRFSFAELRPTIDYRIHATSEYALQPGLILRTEDSPLRLAIPRPVLLRGRVVDGNGEPVQLFHIDGERFEDGTFELRRPAERIKELRVSARGYQSAQLWPAAKPGDEVEVGAVQLDEQPPSSSAMESRRAKPR